MPSDWRCWGFPCFHRLSRSSPLLPQVLERYSSWKLAGKSAAQKPICPQKFVIQSAEKVDPPWKLFVHVILTPTVTLQKFVDLVVLQSSPCRKICPSRIWRCRKVYGLGEKAVHLVCYQQSTFHELDRSSLVTNFLGQTSGPRKVVKESTFVNQWSKYSGVAIHIDRRLTTSVVQGSLASEKFPVG